MAPVTTVAALYIVPDGVYAEVPALAGALGAALEPQNEAPPNDAG